MARVDLSACRACYCLAARRRARAVTRLFEDKLRPHGLRATQFSVLAALALVADGPAEAPGRRPRSTRVTDLADLLGLERTTLTRIRGVLERRGWVASGRAADGRERPLRLTPAGRRRLEQAFPAWRAAQQQVAATQPDGRSDL